MQVGVRKRKEAMIGRGGRRAGSDEAGAASEQRPVSRSRIEGPVGGRAGDGPSDGRAGQTGLDGGESVCVCDKDACP